MEKPGEIQIDGQKEDQLKIGAEKRIVIEGKGVKGVGYELLERRE